MSRRWWREQEMVACTGDGGVHRRWWRARHHLLFTPPSPVHATIMYQKLKIAPTPYCQCGQVEQTASHILQDCPLLGQLRWITWPEGATVRQKLVWGCLGELQRTSSLSRPGDCKCDGDRKEEHATILFCTPPFSCARHDYYPVHAAPMKARCCLSG